VQKGDRHRSAVDFVVKERVASNANESGIVAAHVRLLRPLAWSTPASGAFPDLFHLWLLRSMIPPPVRKPLFGSKEHCRSPCSADKKFTAFGAAGEPFVIMLLPVVEKVRGRIRLNHGPHAPTETRSECGCSDRT
jgi:hypothetical protein